MKTAQRENHMKTYTINTLKNQAQLLKGSFLHIEYSLWTKLMDIVTEKKKNINLTLHDAVRISFIGLIR